MDIGIDLGTTNSALAYIEKTDGSPDYPEIHVLATTVIPGTESAGAHKGEVVPQIWTYEHTMAGGQPARAFVWMQGHEYANFANYQIQQMLLRGIAWAAHQPVDRFNDLVWVGADISK